jgi:PBP1b-binding outer membrane lipoprotein LpoB
MFPITTKQKMEEFIMKKLSVFMMVLILSLSLVGCGGDKNSAPASSTPSQSSSQNKEAEFTPEQQALAQEFMDMTKAFNKVVDRVNATPEVLADEELIKTMNELADEITKADDCFATPETLTPEIMKGLKVAIEAVHKFITEAETALDKIESAK